MGIRSIVTAMSAFSLSACGGGGESGATQMVEAGSKSSAARAALINAASAPVVGGQANVQCNYHHTLADDPILMPNMPGKSMIHDFFGNHAANAFSTTASLMATPATSCDNQADAASYWAPALKRNGVIIKPDLQKTYYSGGDALNFPITPFPAGLKLIAGSPLNTASSSAILYYCAGGNPAYTWNPPTTCPPTASGNVQFNIDLTFPSCWDGKNLSPTYKYKNAVYGSNSACPADYPVRVPQLTMHLQYSLGKDPDMSNVQLSLDPTVNPDGTLTERWGNLYTAHADFFNAWPDQSFQFVVKYCFEKGLACNKTIPMRFSEPSADTYIADGVDATKNFGGSSDLYLTGNPAQQQITMIRFPLPADAAKLDFKQALIRLHGSSTTPVAHIIYFRPMALGWDENAVTWNNAPTCPSSGPNAQLYLGDTLQVQTVDATALVRSAIAAGQTEIALCARGQSTLTQAYRFDSKDSGYKPTLIFMNVQPS